ncbi:MAG: ribbon-helix-helix protein, CopG family [Ruminococcaceae bacterium]|nr:ribbon-helix-helix protein, CopG family [Oscillospiraceae bacterium]
MGKKLEIKSKKYRGETTVISSRVPIDLVERLDEIAKGSGRTRNEVIQLCLEFAAENIEITEA